MADNAKGPRRNRALDPYGTRARWLVYASLVPILGSCAELAVIFGTGWSWGLFLWGVAAGLFIVVCSEAIRKISMLYLGLKPEQRANAVSRVRAGGSTRVRDDHALTSTHLTPGDHADRSHDMFHPSGLRRPTRQIDP